MSYVPVSVSLSPDQVRSLASGKTVRLTHQALARGHHKVFVPQTTALHLAQNAAAKQGGSLKLSATALDHNRKQGGSFLSFLKGVARTALPIASSVIGSRFGPQIGGLAHTLGDAGLTALGAGVRRKPKRKAAKGKTGKGGVAGWGRG
jgi:hypothetical protein